MRQEGGNRDKKEVIETRMIAHSTLWVVVCVPKLGSIIVRCDKAFVLMHITFVGKYQRMWKKRILTYLGLLRYLHDRMLLRLYGQIHVVSSPGLRRGLVVVDDRLSAPMFVQPLLFLFYHWCISKWHVLLHTPIIARGVGFAPILLSELVCNEVNVLRYFTWVDYFTLYL